MKITSLGTSAGAPSRSRNVSATALQPGPGRQWVLVDCGEATQHQLLRSTLSPLQLSAVLITHMHGDHCYGLPGLLASCQMSGRTEKLTLIGPPDLWPYLQAVMRYSQLNLNFELAFVTASASLNIRCAGVDIRAFALSHSIECWGYRFEETVIPRKLDTDKLQHEGVQPGAAWGDLQQGKSVEHQGRTLFADDYTFAAYAPRVVVIAGDNDQPECLRDACTEGVVLVHEATWTEDVRQRVSTDIQHSSAACVAQFAQQCSLAGLILTHFSPRYLNHRRKAKDRAISDIAQEARDHYSGILFLADDFTTYELTTDGRLVTNSE